ncbi:MAG: DUF72 domain-containing protein [Polyangiales bacterium]
MLYVGALLDRAPGRKYLGALRFAELSLRAPLPRPGTLNAMRAALPADFALALRAPRNAVVSARGALRVDAELEAALAWSLAAADALQARAVLLHTPSELTPGARSRDLLREYVARLPRVAGRHYVWAAQGAWEPEEQHALCEELGLVRAFDPLETKSSPAKVTYATLRALGHRAGFSYAALSDALARTLEHAPEEAFVSVDADKSFDIARRLQTLAVEAAGDDENLARAFGAGAGAGAVGAGLDEDDEGQDGEDEDLEGDEGDLDEDESDEDDSDEDT